MKSGGQDRTGEERRGEGRESRGEEKEGQERREMESLLTVQAGFSMECRHNNRVHRYPTPQGLTGAFSPEHNIGCRL